MDKQSFAKRIDEFKDYYHSTKSIAACQNACNALFTKVIYAGHTVYPNSLRTNPDCNFPEIRYFPPNDVSLHFLASVVLEVSILCFF